MSWHPVDAGGRDLATGRGPHGPGADRPAAALAAAPVVAWPMSLVGDDGRRMELAEALGPGGARVVGLLDAVVAGPGHASVDDTQLEDRARATPAGAVTLPLAVVGLAEGVEAAAGVDADWLTTVDRRRAALRRALVEAGREAELEAALHVAVLLATERFDPADDTDVSAHVASGARLWLLTGAVASALAGADPDPFDGWARLVAGGWWPVGPTGGRLVISSADPLTGAP